jgi:hypothetical protein
VSDEMLRVLDLDFFVHGVPHFRDFHAGRLDDHGSPAWDVDKALAFLRERCGRTLQIAVAGVTSRQIAAVWTPCALPRSIGARNVTHYLE